MKRARRIAWQTITYPLTPVVVVLGVLAGCAGAEPLPPPAPAAPQVQLVPQLGTEGRTGETFCLAPAGSGLRVFVSYDGHGRRIFSVTDVTDLSGASPYRCP
jgi:hypothetical protein